MIIVNIAQKKNPPQKKTQTQIQQIKMTNKPMI